MAAEYRPPYELKRKPLQELLPLNKPLALCIDTSDICNFKCEFCFQKYRPIKGQIMSMELFEKIVEDMKQFDEPFKTVNLYNLGEPLINQSLSLFIRKLKANKLAEVTQITTNASLLTKHKSEELIDAGLDRITFSIYGLDDDSYKKFSSAQVSFHNIITNIEYFYKIREKCKVHIKIAGNYFNEEQKQKFFELFGDMADSIYVDNAVNLWPDLTTVNENVDNHIYGTLNVENDRICPQPFYQMIIHSNGMVSPCCADYDKRVIVGDIRNESIKEIWDGKNYQNLRRDILQNNLKEGTRCKNCKFPLCGSTVDITPYREDILKKYNCILESVNSLGE